jgi:YVTN family beta-propeller protein
MVIGEGALWVTNSGDDTVSRVDLETSRERNKVPVGRNPREIASGAGAIWVSNADDDSVTRIDPAGGGKAGAPISVGGAPVAVAVGEGSVWVSNNGTGTVTQIEL